MIFLEKRKKSIFIKINFIKILILLNLSILMKKYLIEIPAVLIWAEDFCCMVSMEKNGYLGYFFSEYS